jgi:hypothetical protein
VWKRIHNNRLLVVIALLAAVVTAAGGIIHSAKDIAGVFQSKPKPADAPELVLRGAQIILSPQPPLGSPLPIHYEVDAVVGNMGSGTAAHCSAQIQTPLGAYYQSLSPPDLSLQPKEVRLVRFGFQDAGLRNVHDGKFVLQCGDFSSELIALKE